jgi:hypothetical protein
MNSQRLHFYTKRVANIVLFRMNKKVAGIEQTLRYSCLLLKASSFIHSFVLSVQLSSAHAKFTVTIHT